MRSKHIGAVDEEFVSCSTQFGSLPAMCAVFCDENNFWRAVIPPQQSINVAVW